MSTAAAGPPAASASPAVLSLLDAVILEAGLSENRLAPARCAAPPRPFAAPVKACSRATDEQTDRPARGLTYRAYRDRVRGPWRGPHARPAVDFTVPTGRRAPLCHAGYRANLVERYIPAI
ncbi:hypothetical protein [Frankia sp. CiP3]|uniref:hypothetical protein n=1 Tax=Frankia sp. CiP3 TaxID=2880971 RepID=UPI001EF50FC8|nr:hypothetical protein [Frankia sp. CiP3]